MSKKALFRLFLLALGVLSAVNSARAEPTFTYDDDKLLLLVRAQKPQTTTVVWHGVGLDGQLTGKKRTQSAVVTPPETTITLKAPLDIGGHRVNLTVDGRRYELWANRGSWYSGPAEVITRETQLPAGLNSQLGDADRDFVLARGFTAAVAHTRAKQGLLVGRTLGFEKSAGVRLDGPRALLLVARGAATVRITLTQRSSPRQLVYWDYALGLSEKFRRYVIPLSNFRPRQLSQGVLSHLYAISMQTIERATPSMSIDIDYLGLTTAGPMLQSIKRTDRQTNIVISGSSKSTLFSVPPGTVGAPNLAATQSIQSMALGAKKLASVRWPAGSKLWLCNTAETGDVCDPPDAPLTTYTIGATSAEEILVDDFMTQVPVNLFRLPTIGFAATAAAEDALVMRRQQGVLTVSAPIADPSGYAGYISELPYHLPPVHLATTPVSLSFRIRGKIPADSVQVGIGDALNHEPKIYLRAYVDQLSVDQWQTVEIPIAAFRATLAGFEKSPELRPLKRVAIVMLYAGTHAKHEFQLSELKFVPKASPLVVARFDGELPKRNAVGGTTYIEKQRDTTITTEPIRDGKVGAALRIKTLLPTAKSYSLLAFGVGTIDTRAYQYLSFWLRGAHGGENITLYLNDGKVRAKMPLPAASGSAAEWQLIKIPLSDFGPRLSRANVRQLIFAWEDRPPPTEDRVDLDEIRFE